MLAGAGQATHQFGPAARNGTCAVLRDAELVVSALTVVKLEELLP